MKPPPTPPSDMPAPEPAPKPGAGQVTKLLNRFRDAEAEAKRARDALFEQVYPELHDMAARFMRAEQAVHTLQPTAVANEAYFKLIPTLTDDGFANRAHFFGAAQRAMWQVLVDHARKRKPPKSLRVALEKAENFSVEMVDVLELNEAIERLIAEGGQQPAAVFQLHYVVGYSYKEIAGMLEIGEEAARMRCHRARMRLRELLAEQEST